MLKGSNVPLDATAVRAVLRWTPGHGVPDVDASALLLGADGRVRSDEDFVFYNQPRHPSGMVRRLPQEAGRRGPDRHDPGGSRRRSSRRSTRWCWPPRRTAAPSSAYGTCGSCCTTPRSTDGEPLAVFDVKPETGEETALICGELYRRGDGWKFRALGAGLSDRPGRAWPPTSASRWTRRRPAEDRRRARPRPARPLRGRRRRPRPQPPARRRPPAAGRRRPPSPRTAIPQPAPRRRQPAYGYPQPAADRHGTPQPGVRLPAARRSGRYRARPGLPAAARRARSSSAVAAPVPQPAARRRQPPPQAGDRGPWQPLGLRLVAAAPLQPPPVQPVQLGLEAVHELHLAAHDQLALDVLHHEDGAGAGLRVRARRARSRPAGRCSGRA